jgi:hypothetical protein
MDNETLFNMILRHGARLEKIENDLRYTERQLLKLDIATQHVQKDDNQVFEKIGCCR